MVTTRQDNALSALGGAEDKLVGPSAIPSLTLIGVIVWYIKIVYIGVYYIWIHITFFAVFDAQWWTVNA